MISSLNKLSLIVCLFLGSCSTLQNFITEPTNLETVTALRQVLDSSAFKALSTLKNMNDNGVLGVLPKEINPVLDVMKTLGLGGDIDKVTDDIARVSKIAGEESAGIMKDAISQLNFGDAVSVVLGGQQAATEVLRQAMYGSVKQRYSSRLDGLLEQTDAVEYWPMAAGAYNLFSSNKVDASLSDFMAERAVDALFLTMGKEESKIRQNPASLGKSVVTKVFDYYQSRK